MPQEELKNICNGCGAKGGIKVPDTMWGLNIKECCKIHDWMFAEGKTYADFLFANAVFIMNLAIVIVSKSNKFLAPLRLARATKYFIAVQTLGSDAFWVDKNKNNELEITYKGESLDEKFFYCCWFNIWFSGCSFTYEQFVDGYKSAKVIYKDARYVVYEVEHEKERIEKEGFGVAQQPLPTNTI